MLVDRLEDYKADVHVTDESGLNSTLVDILKERGCSNVVYAPGMDAGLLAGFEGTITPDANAKDPRELDAVDAVVTESHVTSAQTGTIVLESNETCGRRALTLVRVHRAQGPDCLRCPGDGFPHEPGAPGNVDLGPFRDLGYRALPRGRCPRPARSHCGDC